MQPEWGFPMLKSVEYRKQAQECRALARNVQNEGHKGQLLKMAQAWDSFAAERERSEITRALAEIPPGRPASSEKKA